jgi:DNA repair protein RecN (Recombination protein N)
VLATLSIRDVVLIDRLDLSFAPGLTALTGETGAGKSILLDSLGLACGARAEAALVRAGAPQASVTAAFSPPAGHPAFAVLAEQGMEAEQDILLRRVVQADGRSRAFVNDQPVAAGLLRRLAATLVEVQGQHEQVGLADPATHADLLDAFAGLAPRRAEVGTAHAAWRAARRALEAAHDAIAAAQRDEDWLRHATAELEKLAPEPGEEDALAALRQQLQAGERRAEAVAAALAEIAPRDAGRGRMARGATPGMALRAAARALERLPPPNEPVQPALAALNRALDALAEAEASIERLLEEGGTDGRALERAEERLFALRAMARKHSVTVAELPALRDTLAARLAALEHGADQVAVRQAELASARAAYTVAAEALGAARRAAAVRLDRAVGKELAPLRLDKARFSTEVTALPEGKWSEAGTDAVQFLVATNPGAPPAPLARVASGGELSRLMLALKVVLSAGSPVPTLVFDEVDSGVGGATAAAVGERLARVAQRLQVLVVTHSPQVAARGHAHYRVSKQVAANRTATRVEQLDSAARREEIARMLAGETVTEAARAAADSLLGTAA